MRATFSAVLGAGLCVLGTAAVAAAADWQQLGKQIVDYRTTTVVITVKPQSPAPAKLKLQVNDNALQIDSVKVVPASGEAFDVALNAWVGPGRTTRAIEIPGGPKAIERVEVACRNGTNDTRLARITLLGASE